MSNTVIPSSVGTQLANQAISEDAIAELADEYLPLTISGIDDRIGYANVHSARMVMRKHRTNVEKLRKAKKADALNYGRTVDAEARRLTALLEPIESHLIAEEKVVDDEKERLRNEDRLKAEAEAKAKADAEAAEAKRIEDAEKARIKAEQDAENERLRVDREKLEAEKQKLREAQKAEAEKQRKAQAKIDAERKVIDDEKKRLADIELERARKQELKRAEAEAAERARKETEERIAREKEEAEAKAKEEEAARVRAEELKPDREKLLSVIDAINEIRLPRVSAEAHSSMVRVKSLLSTVAEGIRNIVEEMK